MEVVLQAGWLWFCITFGLTLFIALLMHQQSRFFYTRDVVVRKFSMMDLQLPSSAQELVNLIRGIFLLPPEEAQKSIRALKGQLYLDFILMPAVYCSIFLLCYMASAKMSNFGHAVFVCLAWLQLIAWLCDIIENIYLLKKLSPGTVASKPAIHKAYQALELAKWGIKLTGIVCSVFGFFYFWLVGSYLGVSLHYLVIIIAEILLFVIGGKLFYEKYKED